MSGSWIDVQSETKSNGELLSLLDDAVSARSSETLFSGVVLLGGVLVAVSPSVIRPSKFVVVVVVVVVRDVAERRRLRLPEGARVHAVDHDGP